MEAITGSAMEHILVEVMQMMLDYLSPFIFKCTFFNPNVSYSTHVNFELVIPHIGSLPNLLSVTLMKTFDC